MALDNAEFISELSITDPPGTDPLNQGDDHLRTIKKAVQQSFPNVDAAVPQSAAQMAQMAIKNEVNAFTAGNTFVQGQTFFDDQNIQRSGPSTFARWRWRDELGQTQFECYINTGTNDWLMQRRINGVFQDIPIQVLNANGIVRFAKQVLLDTDGTAGAPSITFGSSQGTGMYLSASNVLNFATAGVDRLAITGSEFNIKSSQVWAADGNSTLPGYAFASDPDSGLFRATTNSITLAVGGATALNFDAGTSAIWAGTGYRFRADPGTLALPSVAFTNDTNTGIYSLAADAIGFASGGVGIAEMRPNGSFNLRQLAATTGITINFKNSGGFTAYNIQYEGTSGFQPRQLSFSRFNPDTGAFIDIPLYIGVDGRVHTALPVLSP